MNSVGDHPDGWGFPIRKSPDQCVLATPRSLSQPITSFIASQCQGIRQTPLLCLISLCQRNGDSHRRHGSFRAGDDPHPRQRPHYPFLLFRLILLCHRHNKNWRRNTENLDFKDLILPINDVKERTRHQRCLVFYAARFRARVMVEADGIEPTTSCLQSRRSPN